MRRKCRTWSRISPAVRLRPNFISPVAQSVQVSGQPDWRRRRPTGGRRGTASARPRSARPSRARERLDRPVARVRLGRALASRTAPRLAGACAAPPAGWSSPRAAAPPAVQSHTCRARKVVWPASASARSRSSRSTAPPDGYDDAPRRSTSPTPGRPRDAPPSSQSSRAVTVGGEVVPTPATTSTATAARRRPADARRRRAGPRRRHLRESTGVVSTPRTPIAAAPSSTSSGPTARWTGRAPGRRHYGPAAADRRRRARQRPDPPSSQVPETYRAVCAIPGARAGAARAAPGHRARRRPHQPVKVRDLARRARAHDLRGPQAPGAADDRGVMPGRELGGRFGPCGR